jgi:hypothetical protein
MIRLVDATSVHPEVLQAIDTRLAGAESELVIPSLALSSAIYEVFGRSPHPHPKYVKVSRNDVSHRFRRDLW